MRSSLVKLPFSIYRLFLSPMLHWLAGPGSGCRFEPTCSAYAQEALNEHGVFKGGALTLMRVCRCQPFARSGFDPVPLRRNP